MKGQSEEGDRHWFDAGSLCPAIDDISYDDCRVWMLLSWVSINKLISIEGATLEPALSQTFLLITAVHNNDCSFELLKRYSYKLQLKIVIKSELIKSRLLDI